MSIAISALSFYNCLNLIYQFLKFKLRFEVHVTVFDNVNWFLQCCKLKIVLLKSRNVYFRISAFTSAFTTVHV